MKTRIVNWLNKPFPFIDNVKQGIILSVIFGIFVFSFLLIFQPFGISDINTKKALFLSGFGFITFTVMLINCILMPHLFSRLFDPEKWTTAKNILFHLWNILLIAFCNWLYHTTIGCNLSVQHSLATFLLMTIAVGIIPSVFFTAYFERKLWNKNNSVAKIINSEIMQRQTRKYIDKLASISSDNKNEKLEILARELVCISSEGNYSNVYYFVEETIEKKLLRLSLKKAEEQLSDFDGIVRCHRSFIINLEQIKRISGNARNYNLHIEKLSFTIPVSRNFQKSIIEELKLVHN